MLLNKEKGGRADERRGSLEGRGGKMKGAAWFREDGAPRKEKEMYAAS
jgi:hypothetical protein